MIKFNFLFITLVAFLITACGAKDIFTSAVTALPEARPTRGIDSAPVETLQPTSLQEPTLPAVPDESSKTQPDANVTHVHAVLEKGSSWTFYVTVEHPDTGWEDYADGWDVVTMDGEVLEVNSADPFTRLLLHPHEGEQPFTRSQGGIVIPAGITQVRVRAHDSIDGFGGKEIIVDLEKDSGPGFEVER